MKSDEAERVQTPVARQVELVWDFERSGLPATKFAELAGVRYQTYATWVQKHKKLTYAIHVVPAGHAFAASLDSSRMALRWRQILFSL